VSFFLSKLTLLPNLSFNLVFSLITRPCSTIQLIMLALKSAALLATLLASLQLVIAAPTDALSLEKRGLALPTKDAPYSVSTANLSAAITCKEKLNGSKNVILLVHGTALTAASWQSGPYWNLLPKQVPSFTPCTVNIPHNALADAQVNAEYVAYAINSLSKKSKNGKVAVVGHSQGGGELQLLQKKCIPRY